MSNRCGARAARGSGGAIKDHYSSGHILNCMLRRIGDNATREIGRTELTNFGCRFKGRADHILLVHGEDEALQSLKGGLEENGCANVAIQEEGVPFEYGA